MLVNKSYVSEQYAGLSIEPVANSETGKLSYLKIRSSNKHINVAENLIDEFIEMIKKSKKDNA